MPEHLLQLRLGADHVDVVAQTRHEGAVGNDVLAVALRSADQYICRTLAVIVAQGNAHQIVRLRHLEADHVDAAVGKRLHGKGGGEADDTADLTGGGKVGIDDHVQTDLPLEHTGIPAVFRIAHTGNGVLGAQLLGNQTADQIGLVHAGHGNHQIRRPYPGRHQHADAGAVALHAHHIQRAVRLGKGRRHIVHQRDVVFFRGHLAGNGKAHLAVADNDNFHVYSSPPCSWEPARAF